RSAGDERDELAPFHCSAPPVLPTEKIAHSPVRQETAALRDFEPAYDCSGSLSSDRYLPGACGMSVSLRSRPRRAVNAHIGLVALARNDWSLSRRSTARLDLCPRRIAFCCLHSRTANCWTSLARSRCLREPTRSYRVRSTASRSQRRRQDHLPPRPAVDLSLMLHLRKSRISASLASTHSSRLAASRACDRSLRAETQRTSWLGRLDACRGSPRFAAVHFS